MKVYYDKEIDAAYIELSKKKPNGVVEISDYVNLDTTENGEIVGIEVIDASKKIPLDTLFTFELDEKIEVKPKRKLVHSKLKPVL